jgi:N-acetyl-anhydromuramyl-L-alanine amidase AmpD
VTHEHSIVVGGREVHCEAPVIGWKEHGLHFAGVDRHETRAIVVHHTGGAGLAPQVFRTLRTRLSLRTGKPMNLSAHFCVEPTGVVYQYCDANLRCQHAGSIDDTDGDGLQESANACTVGIEVVNPASGMQITRGVRRALVREEIHGVEQVSSAFTVEQTASTLALIHALCGAYGLPVDVPMDGDGVLATVMPEADFRRFRGVCGHLHLTRRKRDPGLAILRAVGALTRFPAAPPGVV